MPALRALGAERLGFEFGLRVVAQRLEPERAVLACTVVPGGFDRWCRRCGAEGVPSDSVTRRLAHEPFGWRPTTLLLTVRRFRCVWCRRVWRQDTSRAAKRSPTGGRATRKTDATVATSAVATNAGFNPKWVLRVRNAVVTAPPSGPGQPEIFEP